MPESPHVLLRRRRLRAALRTATQERGAVADDHRVVPVDPLDSEDPPHPAASLNPAESLEPVGSLGPVDSERPVNRLEPAEPTNPAALRGTVVDASPHLLVLVTADGTEVRLPMSAATSVWHGGRAGPAALCAGREVVVRLTPCGRLVDRVWVDITRVTGVIIESAQQAARVDAGPHRGSRELVFSSPVWAKVRVRHPRFEPGQPADVIGVRSYDGTRVVAFTPATAQAEYVGARMAARPLTDPLPARFRGTVTWFDNHPHPPATPRSGEGTRRSGDCVRGAAYPALDPAGDGAACRELPLGCAGLPFLSLGSDLRIENDCAGRSATLPVVACGCVARRFCDRCAECGASARGRIAELTPVSFVELGGELATGCFNATVTVG